MAQTSRVIYQNLIDEDEGPIQTYGPVLESALTPDDLEPFLEKAVGLSGVYTKSGKLTLLAIADQSRRVLIIQFHSTQSDTRGKNRGPSANGTTVAASAGRKLLEDSLLCRATGDIYAFDLAPLALSLYLDHELRITNGVDIQTGCPTKRARDPLTSIKFAWGDPAVVYDVNIRPVFEQMELDPNDAKRTETNLVQRAWVSQRLSTLRDMEPRFDKVPRIDTTKFTSEVS
jgi:hypothetical protein